MPASGVTLRRACSALCQVPRLLAYHWYLPASEFLLAISVLGYGARRALHSARHRCSRAVRSRGSGAFGSSVRVVCCLCCICHPSGLGGGLRCPPRVGLVSRDVAASRGARVLWAEPSAVSAGGSSGVSPCLSCSFARPGQRPVLGGLSNPATQLASHLSCACAGIQTCCLSSALAGCSAAACPRWVAVFSSQPACC